MNKIGLRFLVTGLLLNLNLRDVEKSNVDLILHSRTM